MQTVVIKTRERGTRELPYEIRWNRGQNMTVFATVQQCISYASGRFGKCRIIDRTGTLDRYSDVLKRIGTDTLLSLPEDVRRVIQNCNEIDTKLRLLEAIAETLNA